MKKTMMTCTLFISILILASCQNETTANQPTSSNDETSSKEETVADEKTNSTDSTEKEETNQSKDQKMSKNEHTEQEENSTPDHSEDQPDSKNETQENTAPQEDHTAQPATTEISASAIKRNLSLGTPQSQVKEWLGEPNQQVNSAKDGTPIWRYDLLTTDGYEYTSPIGIDDLDMEGFKSKQVQLIAFIEVEHDQVSGLSLYYYDEKEQAKNYRINDQFEKTDEIQF